MGHNLWYPQLNMKSLIYDITNWLKVYRIIIKCQIRFFLTGCLIVCVRVLAGHHPFLGVTARPVFNRPEFADQRLTLSGIKPNHMRKQFSKAGNKSSKMAIRTNKNGGKPKHKRASLKNKNRDSTNKHIDLTMFWLGEVRSCFVFKWRNPKQSTKKVRWSLGLFTLTSNDTLQFHSNMFTLFPSLTRACLLPCLIAGGGDTISFKQKIHWRIIVHFQPDSEVSGSWMKRHAWPVQTIQYEVLMIWSKYWLETTFINIVFFAIRFSTKFKWTVFKTSCDLFLLVAW